MKNTLPFLLLIICVLGCNKFGPDTSSTSSSNSSANANAAPGKPVKVVDLPATIGKSKEQIKKMINGTPTHEDPWLQYDLPEGSLTFRFDKGKASYANFSFKAIRIGDASISGTDTGDQLATMAGIDIGGKTPTYNQESFENYDYEVAGKKAEVSFHKIAGKFTSMSLEAK